ncbi:hypothetical protein C8R46DRAFT_1226643 [Mycena filopes]|nr:hypothetical protein C8R46DRAFT_1226643 [Mycena filopes]
MTRTAPEDENWSILRVSWLATLGWMSTPGALESAGYSSRIKTKTSTANLCGFTAYCTCGMHEHLFTVRRSVKFASEADERLESSASSWRLIMEHPPSQTHLPPVITGDLSLLPAPTFLQVHGSILRRRRPSVTSPAQARTGRRRNPVPMYQPSTMKTRRSSPAFDTPPSSSPPLLRSTSTTGRAAGAGAHPNSLHPSSPVPSSFAPRATYSASALACTTGMEAGLPLHG